jgi:hypothetical protein
MSGLQALREKALLKLGKCPGILSFGEGREKIITCEIDGSSDTVRYTLSPEFPVRVQGTVFRTLVSEEGSGDKFVLVFCALHRNGLVVWPHEFRQ